MKKLFTNLQLSLIGLVALLAASCQHEKLADAVKLQSYSTVNLSLSPRMDVVANSSYTLTGADLTVPATITFSAPTTAAFTVNLSTNVDTVASLITAGVLPAGTVTFPTGTAAVLPQITVPAGVKSVTFNVVVSRSAMELSYGKIMAEVIKISAPIKGNTIAAGKGTMIFTVKPADILTQSSIHEVAFGTASNQLNVLANPSLFTTGSLNVTVSIPVVLQGDPGADFTVNVVSSPDSVTKYINNGTLTKNVLYGDNNISIENPSVKILAGTNSALLNFSTKVSTLLALQPSPAAPTIQMPTLAFTLASTSKYQISKTKVSTIFVTLDPNYFRPYYGVPFLVKGTIGAVSDPIYAAYYDFGGEGIGYHKTGGKNGDSNWRQPDAVSTSSDYNPRSVVGWTNSTEWLSYSIYVEQTGTYQMNTMLGSPSSGKTYSVYIDNVLINSKLVAGNTTNYSNQQPNLSTIRLTAGYHILKLYWDNAQYDYRCAIFTRLN